MAIAWTSDLEIGVTEIDNQHRELFKQINQLLEACHQGKAKESVAEIIKFLEDYVVTHFGTEENFMIKYNYPRFSSHKSQHQQFIMSFVELKNQLETKGPGPHLVILTNRVVVEWLNGHIRNVDKELGVFLKKVI